MNTQKKPWIVAAILVVIALVAIYAENAGKKSPTDSDTSTSMVSPYGTIILKLGQTGAFSGITIKPVSIAEDSRCAKGIQCIQAGTVRVVVTSTPSSGTVENTIKLGQTIPVSTFTVGLNSVDPYPESGKKISESDYRFTFEVHHSANTGTDIKGLESKG